MFIFVASSKSLAISNQIDSTKTAMETKIVKVSERAKTENEEQAHKESTALFEKAIKGYKNQFSKYLNIAVLNVTDKDSVQLPGFDKNYAPTYGEVMKKYEEDLIKSLTPSELKEYEYLRKKSQSFKVGEKLMAL